jgi:hypothetical protein
MQLLRLAFLCETVRHGRMRMRMASDSQDVTAQSRPSRCMELLILTELYFVRL